MRRGDEQSEARPLRSISPSVTYYPLRGAHPIIDRLLVRVLALLPSLSSPTLQLLTLEGNNTMRMHCYDVMYPFLFTVNELLL